MNMEKIKVMLVKVKDLKSGEIKMVDTAEYISNVANYVIVDEAEPINDYEEEEDVYFTYSDIYEAINTILSTESTKIRVELHKISEFTDVPKSMSFYRQSCGNIGINFINYDDDNDPLAECYDFSEDYLRANASDIAFELSYRPFNDDIHPYSEVADAE